MKQKVYLLVHTDGTFGLYRRYKPSDFNQEALTHVVEIPADELVDEICEWQAQVRPSNFENWKFLKHPDFSE